MKPIPKNKICVLHRLEEARGANVLAAIAIRNLKDKDVLIHAEQLEGAADMMQDWIENIRKELG